MKRSRRTTQNSSQSTENEELSNSFLFKSALNGSRSQEHLANQLLQLFKQSENENFFEEIKNCVQHILLAEINENKIKFLLEFVSLASMKINEYEIENISRASEYNEDQQLVGPFLMNLFDYFQSIENAKSYACRLRMCQLIGLILNNFHNEMDNDVSEKLIAFLIEKLKDKKVQIRVEAAKSLQRFQDPTDSECQIIKAYLCFLIADPSEEVRRTILKIIAKCQKTLPFILNRMQDNKPSVRKTTFLILAKINIRSFSIKQRVNILKYCLTDSDENIRKSCSEVLFANWLSLCDNNILILLKKFDIEQNQEIGELIMTSLLKDRPASEFLNQLLSLQDENVIVPSKLTPESALLWRILAIHQFEKQTNQELNTILPEWTPYTQYLKKWFTSNKNFLNDSKNPSQFILQQLIEISMLFDRSDEMGRNSMRSIIIEFLQDDALPEKLVDFCVKAFAFVELNMNSLIFGITEIVSDILKPLKPENEEEIVNDNNKESDILDNELREERTDLPTLCKVCAIIISLLQMNLKSKTPALDLLLTNFIGRKFQNNIHFNNLIWRIRVLYCFLDKEMAQKLFLDFMEAVSSPEMEICHTTLKCVIDLLSHFGPETFGFVPGSLEKDIVDCNKLKKVKELSIFDEDDEDFDINNKDKSEHEAFEENNSSDSDKASSISLNIISPLADLLECEMDDVRYLVAEGFMKLLYNSKLNSITILKKLIILSFNPTTDPLWRENIKMFLNGYIERTYWGQETLQESLIPVMRVINSAPPSSPLALIDLEQVLNLFLNLTDPKKKRSEEDPNVHNTIAIRFLDEMIHCENDTKMKRLLLRSIKKLNLDLDNADFRKDIIKQIENALVEIFEDSIVKELGKLLRMICVQDQKDQISTSCLKVMGSVSFCNSTTKSYTASRDNSKTKQTTRRKLQLHDYDEDDDDDEAVENTNDDKVIAEDSDPEGTRIITVPNETVPGSSESDNESI